MRVDFPTPGGPVTPTIAAPPVSDRARARAGRRAGRRSRRARSPARARGDRRRARRRRAPRASSSLRAHGGDSIAAVPEGALRGPRRGSASARLDLLEQRRDALEAAAARAPFSAQPPRSDRLSHRPFAERGRSRLGARLDRVALVRLRDGKPARHQERDERGHEVDARPPPIQTSARPTTSVEHARRGHREPEDGVVRAHDRRERASPVLVGGASLHEQPVHTMIAAPLPAAPPMTNAHREPDRAARAPRRPTRRPSARSNRRSGDAARPCPRAGALRKLPTARPTPLAATRSAESEVPRVERLLREERPPRR